MSSDDENAKNVISEVDEEKNDDSKEVTLNPEAGKTEKDEKSVDKQDEPNDKSDNVNSEPSPEMIKKMKLNLQKKIKLPTTIRNLKTSAIKKMKKLITMRGIRKVFHYSINLWNSLIHVNARKSRDLMMISLQTLKSVQKLKC